jgi:hypothetical protein
VYGGVIRRYEGKGPLDIGREIREARKSALQRTNDRMREKA